MFVRGVAVQIHDPYRGLTAAIKKRIHSQAYHKAKLVAKKDGKTEDGIHILYIVVCI